VGVREQKGLCTTVLDYFQQDKLVTQQRIVNQSFNNLRKVRHSIHKILLMESADSYAYLNQVNIFIQLE
jgi:hypothetical protein